MMGMSMMNASSTMGDNFYKYSPNLDAVSRKAPKFSFSGTKNFNSFNDSELESAEKDQINESNQMNSSSLGPGSYQHAH